MKSSLQLKFRQGLTMAPQLQQAMQLLQLSNIELQAKVQDLLDSNMMLEIDEDDKEDLGGEGGDKSNNIETDDYASELMLDTGIITDDMPIYNWQDTEGSFNYKSVSNDYGNLENFNTKEKTLREHLEWQLNLMPLSNTDQTIAQAIIDYLDEDGYLQGTINDISEAIGFDHEEVGTEEIETVLHIIQTMDPAGVGSRNLQECLSIQLKQCDPNTAYIEEARALVTHYFRLLAAHDYQRIMSKMKLEREQLTAVIHLIQSMNPRPGNQISDTKIEYITPDVYVRKENSVWRVELNTATTPSLRINAAYKNMIRRADNSTDNKSLKSHLQEARWFIKSLSNRGETLLRVAACIVERQRAFFEHGEKAMKPLVLDDIATALGMHQTTISRVTSRKYMHTPRGIFELKYFFSSHVSTNNGGDCSAVAIRALIKKLIDNEQAHKPLSDSKIAAILKENGINIARRTIAKYRETMFILPSVDRKRLT